MTKPLFFFVQKIQNFPLKTAENTDTHCVLGVQKKWTLLWGCIWYRFWYCQTPFFISPNPFFTWGSFEHEPLCVKRLRNLALSYDGVIAYISLWKSQRCQNSFHIYPQNATEAIRTYGSVVLPSQVPTHSRGKQRHGKVRLVFEMCWH